ncbi:hypothetical protein ACFSTC_29215 [Nonomuraea ferruginea]
MRLGDFPPTGLVLDPAAAPLRRLIRLCAREPVERADLYALLGEVPPAEIDAAVARLLEARILVTADDLDALAADAGLSRFALFLSMFRLGRRGDGRARRAAAYACGGARRGGRSGAPSRCSWRPAGWGG